MTGEELLSRAWELHRAGKTWREIGAELGLEGHVLRKRVARWRARQQAEAPEVGEAPAAVASPDTDSLLPTVLDLRRSAPESIIDNYLDALIEAQAIEHQLDTEQDEATVELPGDGGPVGIVATGDWHVGNRWTDHALLREHLRIIRETPGLYWLGMGDYADLFLGSKAKIGIQQHIMPLDMQRRAVKRLMVDGKAIAYLSGNHDRWIWQAAGIDYVREAAEEAQRPYLGYGGVLWVRVGEQRYKIVAWHDYPGRSAINPGNNQRRVRADYGGADVVVLAHLHNNYRQEGTTPAGDYLDLRSGTYKMRDDHAAQRAGAKAGDPRMPLIILWPDEHLVWAFRDFAHPKVLATFISLREQYGGKGRVA